MRSLNEPNRVRETLHNLVIKYSSSSNFVFQKETTRKQYGSRKVIQSGSRKVIQASDTTR
jgi:hypothetical protein